MFFSSLASHIPWDILAADHHIFPIYTFLSSSYVQVGGTILLIMFGAHHVWRNPNIFLQKKLRKNPLHLNNPFVSRALKLSYTVLLASMLSLLLGGFIGHATVDPHPYALPLGCIAWFLSLYMLTYTTLTLSLRLVITWIWGASFFLPGTSWITHALMIEKTRWEWLKPICLLGIPGILALFPVVTIGVASWASQGNKKKFLCLIPFLGCFSEIIRGEVAPQFPWHLTGQLLHGYESLMQIASVVGMYGLGFCVLGIASTLAMALTLYQEMSGKRAAFLLGSLLLLCIGLHHRGSMRKIAPLESLPSVYVNIVQPNVAQTLKIATHTKEARARNLIHQTQASLSPKVTHIIWPESAWPFPLDERQRILAPLLFHEKVHLIVGVICYMQPNDASFSSFRGASPKHSSLRLWNGLVIAQGNGVVLARYHKQRLVPFGEYMPFRKQFQRILPWIDKIVPGTIDFMVGGKQDFLSSYYTNSFIPLICYEAIFPIARRQEKWIVNITNDGWFGDSWGPYQHLLLSSMRCLETGLSMVRAANTGISALIDPFGRIQSYLALQTQGNLKVRVPQPLQETLYMRFGPLFLLSLIISIGFLMYQAIRTFLRKFWRQACYFLYKGEKI